MNYTRLRLLERQMRVELANELVEAVRQAAPEARSAMLTRGMEALDVATRAQVYPLLSEDELDLLLPGMSAYLATLTDAELLALDRNERLARRALTQIRRQQRGDGGEQPPEPDHLLLRR
jgi:hypothetical protein